MSEAVIIGGIEYVPKSEPATMLNNMKYVIIRTYSAGVHVGYLYSLDGTKVELKHSRRICYWEGAYTLSELAKYGTEKANECKFSTTLEHIILTEAVEIIECTKKAYDCLNNIKDYKC